VESSASRFLLLEINRVAEEIEIILETFNQQKLFLDSYRDYLNPVVIETVIQNASIKRKTRFEYENGGIDLISKEIDEQIKDCLELQEHVKRLADQNLQLVEGGQDDINKKLMLFTIITIIFLPPSFVAGFFGMNLQGINGTQYTTKHFWVISLPLTAGLLVISLWILFKDSLYSFLEHIYRWFVPDDFDEDSAI
jgi:hypothetical protein